MQNHTVSLGRGLIGIIRPIDKELEDLQKILNWQNEQILKWAKSEFKGLL